MSRFCISAVLALGFALRAAAVPTPPAAARADRPRPPMERLPVRVYTVDDGLAGNEINAILQDSRGFLWIGTDSGLSRFDGSRFIGYDARQGLPSPYVTALLEDPSDGLLVGTTAGLARLDPNQATAARLFQPVLAGAGLLQGRVAALLLAEGGPVWAADLAPPGGGLFRLQPAGGRPGAQAEEVRLRPGTPVSGVTALAPDGAGGLWVGHRTGLLHRLPGGRWIDVPIRPAPPWQGVGALLLDAQRRLWMVTGESLYVLGPGGSEVEGRAGRSLLERAAAGHCMPATPLERLPQAPGEVCRFEVSPAAAATSPPARQAAAAAAGDATAALPAGRARPSGALLQTRDGKVWVAFGAALTEFDGQRFRTYTSANGLLQDELGALAEDRDGNLWVGGRAHGLMRIAHNGFLTYTAPAAPGAIGVAAIFEDSRSNLYVWGSHDGRPQLFHFDGERLENVTPRALDHAGYLGRGRRQVWASDPSGGLWLGSAAAIWRFSGGEAPAALRLAAPEIWRVPEAMGEVTRLFRDSRGQLWVASLGRQDRLQDPDGEGGNGAASGGASGAPLHLARWDPATGRFSPVPQVESLGRGAPAAFAEDPFGNLWIGFSGGGLARLRGDGADLFLTGGGGGTPGSINDLFVDSRQRLWVATSYGGAIRLEDLNARLPRMLAYTTVQGLSSDRVLCVTEDRRGTLYLGHGRGLDQLDPQNGRVRTLTTADGLAASTVNVTYRARDGSLWFGTPAGPSRFLPEVPRIEAPPPVYLADLRIGGARVPLPPLGVRDLRGFELPAGRSQIEVHFIGVSFAYGVGLRYQYRLEGASSAWTEPQAERSVLLGNLAPGAYRLSIRAVTPDNGVSLVPATLSFVLLRPLWQRWWFMLLAAAAAALLAWGLHRAQLARIVELERVRTRIAADLHDDMSSSLSRISILSELARRRVADPAAMEATFLDQIGETARELMEATGDIVWAIDSRRDDLESLLVRIRRFAGDLLEGRGVNVIFSAPPHAAAIALRPEAKRELYLALKEALHNAAKHAHARQVRIEVTAAGGELSAEVGDDGVGFAPAEPPPAGAGAARSGHGLRNLRERAAKLGAKLSIDSAPGAGTRVRISFRP